MTTTKPKNILPAEEVNGLYFSIFLNHLDIKNNISEEDDNLIFVNYDGFGIDNKYIDPLLTIYFDHESNFARFTLISLAPKKVTKKTINPLIDSLNKGYVLTNYESTETDGNFYISGEYWLNYKFGFNPAIAHHIIIMMPAILSGALEAELTKL